MHYISIRGEHCPAHTQPALIGTTFAIYQHQGRTPHCTQPVLIGITFALCQYREKHHTAHSQPWWVPSLYYVSIRGEHHTAHSQYWWVPRLHYHDLEDLEVTSGLGSSGHTCSFGSDFQLLLNILTLLAIKSEFVGAFLPPSCLHSDYQREQMLHDSTLVQGWHRLSPSVTFVCLPF